MTTNMLIPNIAICGNISFEKSLIVNMFAGLFISSPGKKIFMPTYYAIRTSDPRYKNSLNISMLLNSSNLENERIYEKSRDSNNLHRLQSNYLNNPMKSFINVNIAEFPTIGDKKGININSEGQRIDHFLEMLVFRANEFDLMLFVCDANCPFSTKENVDAFISINAKIEDNYFNLQKNTKLIILACNYDPKEKSKIDKLWKKNNYYGMNQRDIYFVDAYQLFESQMKNILILPTSCKQDLIKIRNYLCGKKNGYPEFEYDKIIKKQKFISIIKTRSLISGNLEFISKLGTMYLGLEYIRAIPSYDILTRKLMSVIDNMCPFELINDNTISRIFKNVTNCDNSKKLDIRNNLIINDEFFYKLSNKIYYRKDNGSTNSIEYTTYNRAINDKIIISILCKKNFMNNIPFTVDPRFGKDIITQLIRSGVRIKRSVIDFFNEVVFKYNLEKHIKNLSSHHKSKYITFLKFNTIRTPCIITKQFLKYLIDKEKNDKSNSEDILFSIKNFNNIYLNHIIENIKYDLNYIIILTNEIMSNNLLTEEIISKKKMYELIDISYSNPKRNITMNFKFFEYDIEYKTIIELLSMTFHNLKYLRKTNTSKYLEIKANLSPEIFDNIMFYLMNGIDENTNICPLILRSPRNVN